MPHRATIEWCCEHCGVLRIGAEDFDHTRHMPYVRSCTVVRQPDGTVLVLGLCVCPGQQAAFSRSELRALGECIVREGIPSATFERRRPNGTTRLVRMRAEQFPGAFL